jgi:tetratricopeptide (TPR) repeat protein
VTTGAAGPDAPTQALICGQSHLLEGRFKEASDAFWEAALLKSDSTIAFALTLHCLAKAEGDAVALAFFRTHRQAFEASMTTNDETHRTMVPYLQVNIAWPALESDLPLADAYSQAALDAAPDTGAMLGTRGAYLVAIGDLEAGRALLLRALRLSSEGNDRAEFASALARVARTAGNTQQAEAFDGLGRYAIVA